MKKVLIIGFFWPYCIGSIRVLGLAKYLPELGWENIILTGPLDKKPDPNFHVLETSYQGFLGSIPALFGLNIRRDLGTQLQMKVRNTGEFSRRILRYLYKLIREIWAYPDEHKNWRHYATRAADELIKKERIDAIISVWPVTSHLIAKDLKDKYKIPWVADFPDLWSQNPAYPFGAIRNWIDRRLELKTLSTADALVSASGSATENLKALHGKENIQTVTHGFNPDELNEPPAGLTTKFTITYTGQIYTGKQDPLKILLTLKDLISAGTINPADIEVRFFGPERLWLERIIKNYGLSEIVKQYGIVSHEESIKKQRESQILLLLNWEDRAEKGVYTGKIFEYLATRRPIMSTGGFGSDVVEDLLKETKAGVYAPNIKNVKEYLKNFYIEYKQKGKVAYWGDIKKIDRYSQREMARKFANILDQL